MDLFRLGLRNFLGVLLPGALLVLILVYVVFVGAEAAGLPHEAAILDRWSSAVTIFLVSYLIGNLMRLNSADRVDSKWVENSQKKFRHLSQSELQTAWDATEVELKHTPDQEECESIWRSDQFPYPVWHFYRLRLFKPPDAYRFFLSYRSCMRHLEGSNKLGKEFFNYCKVAVLYSSRTLGDTLALEIQSAEGLVRFYAGTYFALRIGSRMLGALLVWQAGWFLGKVLLNHQHGANAAVPQLSAIAATSVLGWSAVWMTQNIVERFRGMRQKEVDTVYDAFYLVHLNDAVKSEFPKRIGQANGSIA